MELGRGPPFRPSVAARWQRPALHGAASPLVLAAVTGAIFALVTFSVVTLNVPRDLLGLAILHVTLGSARLIRTCRALVMRTPAYPRLLA